MQCMQAFTPSDSTQSPQEIWRRLENLVRWGTVAAYDAKRRKVRCQTGENTTTWIKWIASAAGQNVKKWRAPTVGEQVMIFAPGGELTQAAAIGGLFSDSEPANGESANVERTSYADGTVIEYDTQAHALRISGPNVIRLVTQQLVIDGDVYIAGALHVEKSIRSDRAIMGVQGVWPPRPLQVPRISRNNADAGIAP